MKSLLECGRAGDPLPVEGLTDMHGHLGRYLFAIPDLTPSSVVRVMDRLGVAQMLCSHMQTLSADVGRGNREVLQAMQEHPGRILGYVSVWPGSPEMVREEMQSGLENGFTGLKMHNANGFSYRHPTFAPAYELANMWRRPILFHTWGEPTVLDEIRAIAHDYPEASILLGHSGCTNEEGYLRMGHECPNVYLETCFSRAPRGLLERLVHGAGIDKVVWGSDALFYSQAQQIGRVLGASLTDAEMRQILARNAQRILKRMAAWPHPKE